MKMSAQEIYAKIVELISQQLTISNDVISPESTLESLGADSLDRVEFVMKLEEEFGIEINDDEAEKLTTINQAVHYVSRLLSADKL